MIYLDMFIFFAGWLVGQLLFQGYEAHVPWTKRIAKLVFLAAVFLPIRYWAGREWFYALLAVMAVAMGILHGYYFHFRHGIHWRTAQPRDKYLQLIGDLPGVSRGR